MKGLGNSAYLVDLGDGRALAVDVPRDLRAVRAAAERHGLRSRSPPTRTCTPTSCPARRSWPPTTARRCSPPRPGAGPFRPPGAGRRRRGRPGRADAAGAGHARATPHEHLSFLLLDGAQAARGVHRRVAAGRARRPAPTCSARSRPRSWPGPSTRSLQRAPHAARRDAGVPDPWRGVVLLGPARRGAHHHHRAGEGHQPAAGAPATRTRSSGAAGQPGHLPAVLPAAAASMNRRGPADPGGRPALAPLTAGAGPRAAQRRWRRSSTSARSPTSRPATSRARWPSRCGTRSPPGWAGSSPTRPPRWSSSRDPDQDPGEIIWQALKIGYEQPRRRAGRRHAPPGTPPGSRSRPPRCSPAGQVGPGRRLDVRQAAEYAAGHLPGAAHIELGALASQAAERARPGRSW